MIRSQGKISSKPFKLFSGTFIAGLVFFVFKNMAMVSLKNANYSFRFIAFSKEQD